MDWRAIIYDGRIGRTRKYIPLFSYYIIPILSLLLVSYGIFFNIIFLIKASKGLGYAAIFLFYFIMIVKPLQVIYQRYKILLTLVALRKELGILVFYLALLHSIGYWIIYALQPKDFMDFNDYLIYGLISLIIMFPLYITSNRWSIKRLRWWKSLHRSAYIALIVALVHVGICTGDMTWYILIGIFIILKGIEFYMSASFARRSARSL